jgi:hypothetical protein
VLPLNNLFLFRLRTLLVYIFPFGNCKNGLLFLEGRQPKIVKLTMIIIV